MNKPGFLIWKVNGFLPAYIQETRFERHNQGSADMRTVCGLVLRTSFAVFYAKITPLRGELRWGREFAGEFVDQK